MPPIRSTPSDLKNKSKASKLKDGEPSSNSSVPGVQKIKSSLRQTRRMLAKDNLAADVRIETERRLKSLESDLAKAERTRKERNLAVKYHKVKFFERQKVCRKIKHTKKELDGLETSLENLSSLRETLFSHRVDLNYILHYPKTKRYISLFPSESSSGAGNAETDRQREELRHWVKTAMTKGEMDGEPEVTITQGGSRVEAVDWNGETKRQLRAEKKEKPREMRPSKRKGVSGDAFFEASDGDEEE